MRGNIFQSVALPSLPCVATLPHKGHDFGRDVVEQEM